jgi:hypothetical protein
VIDHTRPSYPADVYDLEGNKLWSGSIFTIPSFGERATVNGSARLSVQSVTHVLDDRSATPHRLRIELA